METFNEENSQNILSEHRPLTAISRQIRVDVTDCLDRSAALARFIVSLLGPVQPTFLWINEWGIWPSLENQDLFYALRTLDGERRKLIEVPGQKFEADESARMTSYLQIVLINGWGATLIGLESRKLVTVSHDSWFLVDASTVEDALVAAFQTFGLRTRIEEPGRKADEAWFRHQPD